MEKQEKGFMRARRSKQINRLLKLVLFILVVALVFYALGKYLGGGSKTTITSDLIETRLEEIAELASVNYLYKNMGQFENTSTFYGISVPFTTKKFILSYSGEIKAGINLKDVEIDLTETTITVEMPEAKILSHVIDEKSITVFDEHTSIFNPIKIDDMTSFTAEQKEQMEKEVIEKGLLYQAKENAQKVIKSMLTFDGYEVVFK